MINRIKTFKLYILQYKYKYITELILRLQKHIDFLFVNNFIDFLQKNHILNAIFLISKNLSLSYNNYIIEKLDNNDNLNLKLNEILILFNNEIDDEIVFEKIFPIIKNFNNDLPLNDHEIDIINIMAEIGFDNLEDLIKIYIKFNLSIKQNELVHEINKIFVPVKIKLFDVSNCNKEYYWRIPTIFNDNDLLKLTRELWIKNKDSKTEYLKIEGYFINDSLSSFIKTSQLNYPILQKNKSNVLNKVDNKMIDPNFIKKFIRYDYLGNIYSMNAKDYIKYIEESYQKFNEISKSTFINIMKKFISKESDFQLMFEYIFLLLLGSTDNADVAGLLLGLTKEKKTNSQYIYNYLNQRLPYYLLVKIKKSHNNIKLDLDKIKSLSIDDIDYKKQLVINKNIPSSVKTITLEKIEEMKATNNEYYKQLTFVKHILNFPWSSQNDNIIINNPTEYLTNIETKLNNLSYGHELAKKVLLQTIGKWISNPSSQGTCFGLVGPPGVGKTLLAKSISKALDIPFAEITLGGQNDGEILHGHGYTYSGSQPGLIIKKMVEMGKSRCILYFDELDKASSKHGSINEITSILIHLTDPNMNKTFQDRFFQGVDFPLDKVIIIFSYNDPKLVDPILLDRIKQIEVNAYNINDKKKIVKNFIIPEIVESIGLNKEIWTNISDELIEYIIENYTNEAGVRSIKRSIEEIFLTLNLDKIYQRNEFKDINFKEVTKEIITRILNNPKNEITKIHEKNSIGIINGLYATNNSEGGIIPIQIFNNFLSNSSSYEIKLTGNQGNVMKESVYCSLTTAFNYIKNNLHKYPEITNFDEYLVNNFKYGFHIHAPSTSTPKDGPSAGCAFTSAFISRILNKPIKNDIAMTGEIELTGKITKIGGLNFKLSGAKKAGVKLVYVPKENENDITEIIKKNPLLIDDEFKVKLFDYIDEIIDEIM
jgi:endopeptidase La